MEDERCYDMDLGVLSDRTGLSIDDLRTIGTRTPRILRALQERHQAACGGWYEEPYADWTDAPFEYVYCPPRGMVAFAVCYRNHTEHVAYQTPGHPCVGCCFGEARREETAALANPELFDRLKRILLDGEAITP